MYSSLNIIFVVFFFLQSGKVTPFFWTHSIYIYIYIKIRKFTIIYKRLGYPYLQNKMYINVKNKSNELNL